MSPYNGYRARLAGLNVRTALWSGVAYVTATASHSVTRLNRLAIDRLSTVEDELEDLERDLDAVHRRLA